MFHRPAYSGAAFPDDAQVPQMVSNVQPAPAPSQARAIYTVSGLTGTPEQKKQRIDELLATLGDHVTIIELPEGVTLNRLA
ncbi:MAG: hypothetical protein ABS59_02745 [Methylobacterium sp. SCN 67-24]|nr:MAG: hypothetical protein ABS59_02745 [Methylobacterium sp. SCN 67-24]